MKKKLIACVLPVFALGFSAPSMANDTFDAMIGNTIHVMAVDGTVSDWMFREDGTVVVSDGQSGTWTMNGDTVCTAIVGVEGDLCTDVPVGKGVGDTWEQTDADGAAITVTLKAGQ